VLESLSDLDRSLADLGGGLVVRRGAPERELAKLAREVEAKEVHFTRDLTPYARQRGRKVIGALEGAGVEAHAHPGLTVADDVTAITTKDERPFSVFSPFHRAWMASSRREVLAAPRRLELPSGLDRGRVPSLDELRLSQEVEDPAPGGESAGRKRVDRFLRGPSTPTGTTTTRSAPTGRRDCRRTCTSDASRHGRSRTGCPRERGHRPSGASSAGATSTTR